MHCIITLLLFNIAACGGNYKTVDSTQVNTMNHQKKEQVQEKSIILSLSNDTLTLPVDKMEVKVINNTDSVCVTSDFYRLEQFINNKWVFNLKKYGTFTDMAYVVDPNGGIRSFSINLQNTERPLEKGLYRICKRVGIKKDWYDIYHTFYIR